MFSPPGDQLGLKLFNYHPGFFHTSHTFGLFSFVLTTNVIFIYFQYQKRVFFSSAIRLNW